MIKRDCRYIIKRILIGVGICLSLSFINSCNVKALNEINMGNFQLNRSPYTPTIDFVFDQDNLQLKLTKNYYSNTYYQSLDISSDFKYLISQKGTLNNYSYFGELFFIDSEIYFVSVSQYKYAMYCKNLPCHFLQYENDSFSSTTVGHFNTITITSNSSNNPGIGTLSNNQNIGTVTNYYVNFDLYNNNNILIQSSNSPVVIQPQSSTIESLGIVKNKNQEENVITSYTFNPTFTNFDTTNFTYQYKIGNGDWLGIGISNYTFNINQNTTVYFRVLKKSDNSVLDSRSITITNIMKYNDNVNDDYNITYSSENKSVQEESSINRTIDTVTVNFEYFPKQSNLKYQYQYVNTGDSLSSWIDMPNNDYERGYSVNVNGTMYNRILDENDNVLYTSTFTVDSIGKLMFDSDISWYNSLFNKINYGSGIGTIFYLPLKIVQTVHDSYSETCQPINLGALLGTTLYMPCIDIESLIGSNLYNIIDVIFMGFIALSIIRFIVNVYNRIISLNFEGNDDGSGALFL